MLTCLHRVLKMKRVPDLDCCYARNLSKSIAGRSGSKVNRGKEVFSISAFPDKSLSRGQVILAQHFWRPKEGARLRTVSYTHLRAHETVLDLVCRLLLEKKK